MHYPAHEIHASLKTLDKRQKECNGYYKFSYSTIREWLGLPKQLRVYSAMVCTQFAPQPVAKW